MRHRIILPIVSTLALGSAARLGAQEQALEGHVNWSRTTQTHQNSWGAGAQYQLTFGATHDPLRLGASLGGDYQKQENGGPSQFNVSTDVTVQPGGSGAVTPYVGGSVGANWMSGSGAPSGTKLGLNYIVGAQVKPDPKGPIALRFEVRPGYVRTQEHAITFRLGVSSSIGGS